MRKRVEPEDFRGEYHDEVRAEDLLVTGCRPERPVGRMSLDRGIYDALWQISLESGLGLVIDIRRIRIPQSEIAKCDREGINPYEIPREGEIFITRPVSEYHLRNDITVIGYMTEERICRIINKDRESFLGS